MKPTTEVKAPNDSFLFHFKENPDNVTTEHSRYQWIFKDWARSLLSVTGGPFWHAYYSKIYDSWLFFDSLPDAIHPLTHFIPGPPMSVVMMYVYIASGDI